MTVMAAPVLLKRRPSTVEAMQVQANNLAYVAVWASGVIAEGTGVWIVTDTGQSLMVKHGDWIVKGPAGSFYPVPDETLFAGYESVV